MGQPNDQPSTPLSNRDFDFFYHGLAQKRLLVQQCAKCGAVRCPPGPACPDCHSFSWSPRPLSGTGVIYSYTVHHHPALAGFATPLPVALVEMDESIRMVGPMDGTDPTRIHIGAKIDTRFIDRNGVAGYRFVLIDGAHP